MKQKIVKALFDFNPIRALHMFADVMIVLIMDGMIGLVWMSVGVAIAKVGVILPWYRYAGLILGLMLVSAIVALVKYVMRSVPEPERVPVPADQPGHD